jgi:hypothetical protein
MTRDPFQLTPVDLVTQLSELAETIKAVESRDLERAEPTQLRLAVHRLGMFAEHLDQLIATSEPDASALSRRELNDQAAGAGVEAPEKLPNKRAVADAIQAAEQPQVVEEPVETVQPTEGDGEPETMATSSRI